MERQRLEYITKIDQLDCLYNKCNLNICFVAQALAQLFGKFMLLINCTTSLQPSGLFRLLQGIMQVHIECHAPLGSGSHFDFCL